MSIKNQVEAIIFLGGDENKIKDLARFFKISVEDMLKIILELKNDRKDSGINIEVDADLVYLATNPIYGEVINSYFEQETKPKKLSSASIETLSIIAYTPARQRIIKPITITFIFDFIFLTPIL